MIAGLCFGILVMWCEPDKPTVTREFCKVSKIIRPSRNDTAQTKRQILAHNRKYRRLCVRKPVNG